MEGTKRNTMKNLPDICSDCLFNWNGFCSLKEWIRYSKHELIPFDLDTDWGITGCERTGIRFED